MTSKQQPKSPEIDVEAASEAALPLDLQANHAANATRFEAYISPRAADRVPSPRGASILMMIVIGTPRIAISMAWAAQWAALGPYLGTMLPRFAVQLTQIIGPVSGILAGSTIGLLSDRCCSRWGRRRPFILIAALATVVCWIFMGFTRQIGEALGDYGSGKDGEKTSRKWTATLTILLYAWMDIAVNVIQTPTFLLMADLAGDRQTTGAAIGQGLSTLGAVIISVYIELFGPAHNSLGYFLGMLSAVMLVSVSIVCWYVHEEPIQRNPADTQSTCNRMGEALYSIIGAVLALPRQLVVFYVINVFITYGYIAYAGNKGQFFGLVVFDGKAESADNCGSTCSAAQKDYNRGVRIAGGSTDIMFNLVGYAFSWAIPLLVAKFGAKTVLAVAQVPQAFLAVMAFSKTVWFDVLVVVLISISQTAMQSLVLPIIIHVLDDRKTIGKFVGAVNSGNCLGQLINFAIGTVLIDTALGYKLPLLLGGIMTVFGILTMCCIFKLNMHSM